MNIEVDTSPIQGILDRNQREVSSLVMVLQDVQDVYNYLPPQALEEVSLGLNIPLSRIYSVATFFKAFSLTPRGRRVVQVCTGTACHVRGARILLEDLEREIGIKAGQTRKDLEYTLECVNCVGACAMGPVVVVNGEMKGNMTVQKAGKIVGKERE